MFWLSVTAWEIALIVLPSNETLHKPRLSSPERGTPLGTAQLLGSVAIELGLYWGKTGAACFG